MVSRILVKLIDQAITPAVILVALRVGSVAAIGSYLGYPLSFTSGAFVFQNTEDFVIVNSYSIMIMVGFLAVAILYNVVKSHIFHETHIHPNVTAHLYAFRLSSLIQSSFDLYSQAAILLSYAYLMTFVTGVMVFAGLIFGWVFAATLILTIVSTIAVVLDIENEANYAKFHEEPIEEEVFLNFKI